MKTQTFTASITQEDKWFIAQCLEVDVSSQGKSEDEAGLFRFRFLARFWTPQAR